MRQLVEGCSSPSEPFEQEDSKKVEFQNRLYDSFLDILIQSLSSSSRDVRDMIRLGHLWPTYIEPLRPERLKATLESIRARFHNKAAGKESSDEQDCMLDNEALQKEILMVLDQHILPHVRSQLERGLFTLKSDLSSTKSLDTATHGSGATLYGLSYDLPYLSKCLILAAFICQTNKPDKDQQLFTIQKSGRRSSRKRAGCTAGDAEGVAYGSTTWDRQQLKILRPRSFPLERMLSVFVNITGLLQGGSNLLLPKGETSLKGVLRSMGSDCFFESLAQLRDIGILREVGGGSMGNVRGSFSPMNMSDMKYWCSLTRDEAEAMAKSIDFPLFKFLI